MGTARLLRLAALCLAGCGSDASSKADASQPDGGARCSPEEATTGFYPCEIQAIVGPKCQRCHDEPAVTDECAANDSCLPGPFSLASWGVMREPIFGDKPTYVRMAEVVRSGMMPYQTDSVSPPVQDLTADEEQTLLEWLDSCAPPAPAACD